MCVQITHSDRAASQSVKCKIVRWHVTLNGRVCVCVCVRRSPNGQCGWSAWQAQGCCVSGRTPRDATSAWPAATPRRRSLQRARSCTTLSWRLDRSNTRGETWSQAVPLVAFAKISIVQRTSPPPPSAQTFQWQVTTVAVVAAVPFPHPDYVYSWEQNIRKSCYESWYRSTFLFCVWRDDSIHKSFRPHCCAEFMAVWSPA